jgi:hypothetical protein
MASPSPAADVLKFRTNVPEVVSLAFATGREVTSQFSGDQIMYTLEDGRRMYLPPFVGQEIDRMGIRTHEAFEITKAEVSHGNRRTVEFQIRRLPTSGRSHSQQSPTADAAISHNSAPQNNTTDYSQKLQESIEQAQARRDMTPPTPPPTAPADTPMVTPLCYLMENCISGIVDAAIQAEQHARGRGLKDFAFSEESIERMAVSVFIEYNKRGSR